VERSSAQGSGPAVEKTLLTPDLMDPSTSSMTPTLLAGLHQNLWASLRHTFNTDRVMLGVAYVVNFAAFLLLLALLPDRLAAAGVSLACLGLLNALIHLSLRNSRREAARVLGALQQIYQDNGLGRYFGPEQGEYYLARYRLWLILQPGLMLFAVAVAVAIKA
jgi:hypothetical protein